MLYSGLDSTNRVLIIGKKLNSETHKVFVQYRGQLTEEYIRALKRINAPCKVILTLET